MFDYKIDLKIIQEGFDGETCWVQFRAGAIPPRLPDTDPQVVAVMQQLYLKGSDVFGGLNTLRSKDLGKSWTGPIVEDVFKRKKLSNDTEIGINDFTPKWHKQTGVLLGTGHNVRYKGFHIMPNPRPRDVTYGVYNEATEKWNPPKILKLPDDEIFFSVGAGSTQRVDLADGTILLPVYCKRSGGMEMFSMIMRCSFDGETLKYIESGNYISISGRGVGEPSLVEFAGKYFLTLRNEFIGYVCTSDDGLNFGKVKPWCFDDGEWLGNYHTQQHWVKRGDQSLYLVYTRRGADNDNAFRHRAPLFIAQVDPNKLCIIRDTEQVLVPNRGARLGNFAVCEVSDKEVWVTVTEWMQTIAPNHRDYTVCQKYGSNNAIFVAKIIWE